MARKPTVSVVGAGRVGGAIGLALSAAGYDVVAAWARSRAGRQRAHQFLDCPILEAPEAAGAAQIVVLAVPDDAIEAMAKTIAPATHAGQLVFHTSGGTSIEILAPVRDSGARIGCLHPLQTFPDPERGAEALNEASVAVTCDPAHRTAFMRIARAWGGRPFPLADEDKRVYHAAAVFASNYVVSSVWAATALLEARGIRNAGQLLGPLVRASVENVLARGGSRAITGPVARGDVGTVRRHVGAIRDVDPTGRAITDAYRSLAKMTAALAGGDATPFHKATST